jgi:hypothetical protein
VPVLFLIAIVVVLVGIFFAATGRGGELAREPADHAPLDLGPVSAADIALLRPPTAMWGYNVQVTDEALDQIARAMRERDITIAYLQEQLAGYEGNGSYTEPRGAHARQDAEAFDEAETREPPEIAGARAAPEIFGIAEIFGPPGTYEDPDALDPPDILESHEARQSPEDLEVSHSAGAREPLETPGTLEPLESPELPAAAEPAAAEPATTEPATTATATAPQAPGPPRTALILKAAKPTPEPHEATQPSQILQDPGEAHDATEPSAVLGDDEDPGDKVTQPSATLPPDETPGPQGAFDTHGWWALQKEAAREEQAHRQAAGEQDDDSVATAEEQGW